MLAADPSALSVYPVRHPPSAPIVLATHLVAAADLAFKTCVVRQNLQSPSRFPVVVAAAPLDLSVYPAAHVTPPEILLAIQAVAAAGRAFKVWVVRQNLQSPVRV